MCYVASLLSLKFLPYPVKICTEIVTRDSRQVEPMNKAQAIVDNLSQYIDENLIESKVKITAASQLNNRNSHKTAW